MKIRNVTYITLLLWIVVSCKGIDSEVKEVLSNASPRQQNMLSAFMTYASSQGMEEKAKYIVANLPNKHSTLNKQNTTFQRQIDSIAESSPTINNSQGNTTIKQSIQGKPTWERIPDLNVLQADSLESSMYETLRIWEQTPWNSEYPKDIFLRYVLPYRIAENLWNTIGEQTHTSGTKAFWHHTKIRASWPLANIYTEISTSKPIICFGENRYKVTRTMCFTGVEPVPTMPYIQLWSCAHLAFLRL